MILSYVLVGILVVDGCFHGINYGLPKYISEQNFGLVDILYRFLKIIAPIFFMYPMVTLTWHGPSILVGIILYLAAFGIKRLARYLTYEKEYDV